MAVRTTSLAYAVRSANVAMVTVLMSKGAKVSLSREGDGEIGVADSFGNTYEASLLLTAVNNCARNR